MWNCFGWYGLIIGGFATYNNLMTAIELTMVAVPALISGVGALFSGATYLSIIGEVTAGAGVFTGAFATGVLTSIGNAATPNQMMNSFNNNPNRWKTVKELIELGWGCK